MIIESEDFVKWFSMQAWELLRDKLQDGDEDIFDETTRDLKVLATSWFMIGEFRRQHGLDDQIIYGPEGQVITLDAFHHTVRQYKLKYGNCMQALSGEHIKHFKRLEKSFKEYHQMKTRKPETYSDRSTEMLIETCSKCPTSCMAKEAALNEN